MKGLASHEPLRLWLLAIALAATWWLAAPTAPQPEERTLWERIRAAQLHLATWRAENGTATEAADDPWQCGLIGVEWSPLTTTLGDLSAKRTACHPAWAIQFARWYREAGLQAGDPIAIYASSSFPGLLLSALTAAESLQLDTLLVVSLGASTWGANDPRLPWPMLEGELHRTGFIHQRANYYTLGGDAERGLGLSEEVRTTLINAVSEAGIPLLEADSLEDMVARKAELLKRHRARLLVSIGGSQANLGNDPAILKLAPGPVPLSAATQAGNGVIAAALRENIPVLHLLNLRPLAQQAGIPWDAEPREQAPLGVHPAWALLGLALFFGVLATHRRWRLEEDETPTDPGLV